MRSWQRSAHEGIGFPCKKRRREQSLLPLSHADTARKPLSTSREAGAHQVPNLPAPWPRTAQPPEEGNVCCLSHPACGAMSEQPQQTKTATVPRTVASADLSGTGKVVASWSGWFRSVAVLPIASGKPAHNFVDYHFPVTQLECAFPFLLGHSLTGVYFLSRD